MRQSYLLCLVLMVFSCSSPESDLYVIDPGKLDGDIITMSDIADDITYIPLENKFPIGMTYTHRLVNGAIYISAKDIGIMVFNNNGKEVRRIGVKGNGPGEYHFCLSFAVDERTGNIYVLDMKKVKVYSPSGIFIKEIAYSNYIDGRWAHDVEIVNSSIFLSYSLCLGKAENSWVFLDTLGNLVSAKKNSVPSFETNLQPRCIIYRFEDDLLYFNYYNDTLFSISPDCSWKAAGLFSRGDYRYPKTHVDMSDPVAYVAYKYEELFTIKEMFETRHYIVFGYSYKSENAICFISKKTKEKYLAYKYMENQKGKMEKTKCLLNDLDGGVSLTEPNRYYATGNEEYITTLITPYELKMHVSGDEFKKVVPKNPEKKADLERLANSLNETDNPVLMMVRLKK